GSDLAPFSDLLTWIKLRDGQRRCPPNHHNLRRILAIPKMTAVKRPSPSSFVQPEDSLLPLSQMLPPQNRLSPESSQCRRLAYLKRASSSGLRQLQDPTDHLVRCRDTVECRQASSCAVRQAYHCHRRLPLRPSRTYPRPVQVPNW